MSPKNSTYVHLSNREEEYLQLFIHTEPTQSQKEWTELPAYNWCTIHCFSYPLSSCKQAPEQHWSFHSFGTSHFMLNYEPLFALHLNIPSGNWAVLFMTSKPIRQLHTPSPMSQLDASLPPFSFPSHILKHPAIHRSLCFLCSSRAGFHSSTPRCMSNNISQIHQA